MDWRVDSAWLLAASSLVSANVKLDDPVCSTLIRFLLKSWRICTIERFEPSAEACDRNISDALLSLVIVALAKALSRKSAPEVSGPRPRPGALEATPLEVGGGLAGFFEVSLRSSPFSRLMPLKDES